DKKIVAVDDVSKIDHYQSDEIIDAGDRLVMPGFHDSHLHLMAGALFTAYSVFLGDATSLKEVQQLLSDFAKQTDNKWVIGTGWDHTACGQTDFPTCHDIDEV